MKKLKRHFSSAAIRESPRMAANIFEEEEPASLSYFSPSGNLSHNYDSLYCSVYRRKKNKVCINADEEKPTGSLLKHLITIGFVLQ